ncbi:hypothetical protein LMG27952_04411 [Paraburkholderia hiiakae]|uniref:Uncharacterized protein n=1 Tax=Paraburkholderia hiiakae TaxID=1081782 RepID=A0ABN7I275_9BURK|nr:hypothetical protein LMG27952_04411 [Paraburkholderia hiiakae]
MHIESDAAYRYGSFGKLEDQFDQSVTGLKACEQAVVAMIGLRFPRFFAFQRSRVMQPHPLSAEPQASLA